MTNDELLARAEHWAGNWQSWEYFAWSDQPDTPELWMLISLCHRDTTLGAKTKAHLFELKMRCFAPDTITHLRFHHYLVGWIDAMALKVYRGEEKEEVTPAFKHLMRYKQFREVASEQSSCV